MLSDKYDKGSIRFLALFGADVVAGAYIKGLNTGISSVYVDEEKKNWAREEVQRITALRENLPDCMDPHEPLTTIARRGSPFRPFCPMTMGHDRKSTTP